MNMRQVFGTDIKPAQTGMPRKVTKKRDKNGAKFDVIAVSDLDSRKKSEYSIARKLCEAAILQREDGGKMTGQIERFPQISRKMADELRQARARLYTYLKRYIYINFPQNTDFAVGVFAEKGCLLDLLGPSECLRRLEADGIRPGTVWVDIGRNAVAEGIRNDENTCSVGEENEFLPLQRYAIYYAPINLISMDLLDRNTLAEHSGIALLVPVEKNDPVYEMLLSGMAHALMMTLQFNNLSIAGYEQSGMGVLAVDTMMNPNTVISYYSNQELFDIFGMKPLDIYYKSLTLLIDPLPANEEFWSIVSQRQKIRNQPLTLSARGRTVSCVATTDVYYQPSIRTSCIVFYLTTPEKIAQGISSRIGNNALSSFSGVIGRSPALLRLVKKAELLAQTDVSVMILGESGTGKDVFASAIHNAGKRANKPFIALNCAALPRDLIASELFGYEGGAFTGAKRSGNIGKFELANGGTLFLDEIGELPLDMQASLLRAVEQKQFTRIGGNTTIKADVRIISATNANIMEDIRRRRFREDLFYRLAATRLELPPLRSRGDDIILLAQHFMQKTLERMDVPKPMTLTEEAKALLRSYPWPGNVRELQNVISCIMQIYPGNEITAAYILENLDGSLISDAAQGAVPAVPAAPAPTARAGTLTREDIMQALAACGGNRTEAANYLGIARRTLYRNMERFHITD